MSDAPLLFIKRVYLPALDHLAALVAEGPATLLYAARDEAHNHALVLADYLRKHGKRAS